MSDRAAVAPAKSGQRAGPLPSFLPHRNAGVAATVMVAALLWRASFLLRLRPSPLAELLEMDSRIYWEWAGLLLSNGWVGTHQFFMAPLYPYALALVRAFGGDSILVVQVLQCLASSATIGVLAMVATRLHGWRWGLGIGLLLAGYGPWLFFDAQIVMEPLLLALQAILLWCLVAQGDRPLSTGRVLALGCVIGLMSLGRATNLLLAIPVGGWVMLQSGRDRGVRRAVLMLAVVLAVAVPTSVRSWILGREWIPYTYGLGYNAYVGNGTAATGGFVDVEGAMDAPLDPSYEGGALGDGRNVLARLGHAPTPARSSDLWLERTAAEIAKDPARWLRLLARKAALIVNDEETSQIQSPRVYEAVAGPLGWPGVGRFGFVALFGLLGVVVGLRGTGVPRVLASVWLVMGLSSVVFFVTDRYRMHLVPTTALLVPVAVSALRRAFADRSPLALSAGTIGLAISAWLVFRPIAPTSPEKVRFETSATLASAYLQSGRTADARRELATAIELDHLNRLPGAATATGRAARSGVHAMHAFLAMNDGDWPAATAGLAEARRIEPPGAEYVNALAIALAADGLDREAHALVENEQVNPARLREELLLRIADSEAHGRAAAREGYLRALNTHFPHWEPGVVALVRVLLMKGDLQGARGRLEIERASGLRDEIYRVHLAAAAHLAGDPAGARRLVEQVPESLRRTDPVVLATLTDFGLADSH